MGKIFCLMGKSASGKDTVYNRLLARKDLRLKRVVLYTTRPIREGEEKGSTYFFCSDAQADQMEADGRVIEMRAYHTVHGIWRYFTADDGQIDLSGGDDYLMIGTLETYTKLCAYFGEEAVRPVYIYTEDGLRLARALARERAQAEPKYAELCRRYLADEEDFSPENLAAAGISRRFENTDLDRTVDEAAAYIRELSSGGNPQNAVFGHYRT